MDDERYATVEKFKEWKMRLPAFVREPIGVATSDYWTYMLMCHPDEYGYDSMAKMAATRGVAPTPFTVFIWTPGGMGISRLYICPDFRTTHVDEWLKGF